MRLGEHHVLNLQLSVSYSQVDLPLVPSAYQVRSYIFDASCLSQLLDLCNEKPENIPVGKLLQDKLNLMFEKHMVLV